MKIILEPKELNFNYVDLRFSNSDITLTTQLADSSFLVDFDHGEWRLSETERAGPNIFGVKGSMSHLDPFKTATSYKWTAKNTLELSIRYVESPHKELK